MPQTIYDKLPASVLQKVLAGLERDFDRTHHQHSAAHYSAQMTRIQQVLEHRRTVTNTYKSPY